MRNGNNIARTGRPGIFAVSASLRIPVSENCSPLVCGNSFLNTIMKKNKKKKERKKKIMTIELFLHEFYRSLNKNNTTLCTKENILSAFSAEKATVSWSHDFTSFS